LQELEGLETQLGETRLKLSKMEVVELELNVLKESTKYKEDDKRVSTLKYSRLILIFFMKIYV
jgi:hypothetical protein